jgi:hypothetical protein
MATQRYIIGVTGEQVDDATAYEGAAELVRMLRDSEGLDVSLVRGDAATMDFGRAINVLAASPSAVKEITRVVAAWLRRNPSSTLSVNTADESQSLLEAASFDPDLARRITEYHPGQRLNRVISPSGNVVTSTGAVSGVVPVEPWPDPKQSRK